MILVRARSWVFILVSISLVSSVRVAISHAAAPQDVDAIAKDFEKTKKTLEEAELKQRRVLSALYQINKKIKKIVTDRGNLSQQRSLLEVNIKSLEQKVSEIEGRTKSQKALLAERLRVIYKLGGQSLARLLLSSASSSEVERNLKILGIVAQRDLELVKNYSRDLQDLQSRKKILAQRLDSLKTVEEKIVRQEKNLVSEQIVKNKILDGIRKSRLFAINKINGLREKSLQFNLEDAGLFDLLFKPSFADHKGTLPHPTEGPIVKRFGLIKGQDHPYTLNHKGIFISASPGAPVKSVFGGTVSYVGDLPGFGKTLIIDHGDHYYTVYAHTDEIKVSLGEEISQAQVVASAGVPAMEKPSGLYFEIRHFSEPYDPQQWMKGL
ncbi:Murein hydrolase activator EnvC precursor [compost metagenome]